MLACLYNLFFPKLKNSVKERLSRHWTWPYIEQHEELINFHIALWIICLPATSTSSLLPANVALEEEAVKGPEKQWKEFGQW